MMSLLRIEEAMGLIMLNCCFRRWIEEGTNVQFYGPKDTGIYAETNMVYLKVAGTLNICGTEEKPVNIYTRKN